MFAQFSRSGPRAHFLFWEVSKLAEPGTLEHRVGEMLRPAIEGLGYEFVGLELTGGNGIVRVYIDTSDGVTVDDCAEVSRHVSGVMDVEDPITGEYTLEVSSPGVDRLLFRLDHYPLYVGEWIELRLRVPFEGRRKFKGTLKGLEGDEAIIQVDDHEYLLPRSAVDKARIEPRI